jgi:hypothetical protein
VKSFNNHNKLLLLVIPVILLGLTSILRWARAASQLMPSSSLLLEANRIMVM